MVIEPEQKELKNKKERLKMMKRTMKVTGTMVMLLCMATSGGAALPSGDIDSKWNAIAAAQDVRLAGKGQANELREILDRQKLQGSLYGLWQGCFDTDAANRLESAWTILMDKVPGGDPARWQEVCNFQLPQEIPNAFMVIDALYTSLIELPSLPGGDWLAADLLHAFSASSHGRFDFLRTCPASVAEAIKGIVQRTGLRGNWDAIPMGELPIARSVDGTLTGSSAASSGMVFLDGSGIPANNGSYAWDRKSGKIYKVHDEGGADYYHAN